MNAKEILKLLEVYDYWDSRVIRCQFSNFCDEIVISFESDNKIINITFESCYKIEFNHEFGYKKNIRYKNMKKTQIPYFIQNIDIKDLENYEYIKYYCLIDMFPVKLGIYCSEIRFNYG